MRKILFGVFIGFVVAGLLSVGTIIVAQERRASSMPQGPLVVLGGLNLQEGSDMAEAEKLFKEQLVPGLDGLEGLKLKVLKNTNMRKETREPGGYDYIMMAEISSLQAFTQLRNSPGAGLDAFGDMMKKHAGHPYFNIYTILTKTKEPTEAKKSE